jgi:endonuclease YncB( thermonuclease family)
MRAGGASAADHEGESSPSYGRRGGAKGRITSPFLQLALALLLCVTLHGITHERVVDGDTFEATFRVWPTSTNRWLVAEHEPIRLLGVDAWESDEPRGPAATAFAAAWLRKGPFDLMVCGRDHFGRLLGTPTRGPDNLAKALIRARHGVTR